MRLFLLLPLIVSCLQGVDHALQDASASGNTYLHIADQKVIINSNDYEAKVTKMEFVGRNGNFGRSVKLSAGTPLKDAGKLIFKNIGFKFTYNEKNYDCTLPDKMKSARQNNPDLEKGNFVMFLRKIEFDVTQDCPNPQNTVAEEDPLADAFKELGLTYEKNIASAAMSNRVEGVTWDFAKDKKIEGKPFHHYTYKVNNCHLDIWIDGDTTAGAVAYLTEHANFISEIDDNLVISGQHGNILIKCIDNGFVYLDSNKPDNKLFAPQMADSNTYSQNGNSHLYLSGKDDQSLTIVAALRLSAGLMVTLNVTPTSGIDSITGREARIYTADESGVIKENFDDGKRTIVVVPLSL